MVREQLLYYEETNVKNIFFLGTNNKETKLTEEENNGK
jgi:hypothetical protein